LHHFDLKGLPMKKLFAALAFSLASVAAWALPTTQEVEAAVQQGRYPQAETMMAEVVAAKPDSAKAHYVYAEMLAHNGNFTKATAEAARARQLDPAVKFTTPEKLQAFELLLQREQAPQTKTRAAPTAFQPTQLQAAPANSGIPSWVWLAGLAAVAFFLWRSFSRSRAVAQGAAAGPGNAMAAGGPFNAGPPGVPSGAPAYGPGMPQASAGSGMLGTGLAVAGGVAGGMLLDEMIHHRQGAGSSPLDRVMPSGLDAPATNEAANELESRPVDFGNGGDWDAGGSTDGGGGSDGGGGWD
jgi:hypothetical protein